MEFPPQSMVLRRCRMDHSCLRLGNPLPMVPTTLQPIPALDPAQNSLDPARTPLQRICWSQIGRAPQGKCPLLILALGWGQKAAPVLNELGNAKEENHPGSALRASRILPEFLLHGYPECSSRVFFMALMCFAWRWCLCHLDCGLGWNGKDQHHHPVIQ